MFSTRQDITPDHWSSQMGGGRVEFETRELRYISKYKGDLASLASYQLTIAPILILSLLFTESHNNLFVNFEQA